MHIQHKVPELNPGNTAPPELDNRIGQQNWNLGDQGWRRPFLFNIFINDLNYSAGFSKLLVSLCR